MDFAVGKKLAEMQLLWLYLHNMCLDILKVVVVVLLSKC